MNADKTTATPITIQNKFSYPAQPQWKIITAFGIVYIVWGSTYFFIKQALISFPPFMIGAIRFTIAGLIMLAYAYSKGERIQRISDLKTSAISGFLILFIEIGIVIWVEQSVSSGFVATMLATSAIWFVILDKREWASNFGSWKVIAGIFIGICGIVLLFIDQLIIVFSQKAGGKTHLFETLLLVLAASSWCLGALYSKYNTDKKKVTPTLNVAVQMLFAGFCFLLLSTVRGEFTGFDFTAVSAASVYGIAYLISFGSILAYTSYMWLLSVRPASQVGTHSYVNPIVAVALGVWFGAETIGFWQVIGLTVVLSGVILINGFAGKKKLAS